VVAAGLRLPEFVSLDLHSLLWPPAPGARAEPPGAARFDEEKPW
jgi:hypothetical protein